ncbi:MAG: peptidylprolyl isomerase [Candidatus Woesearchaeota archaeon]
MPIRKKDFIEIEFTGKLKEDGSVFDTTNEAIAHSSGIYSPNASYGPLIICIGQKQILPGLEARIEGKEPGSYTIELKPEEAFGTKDPKLLQLIPLKKFLQQGIRPIAGLQINIDGAVGTVRAVSGGRCVVDFNHPLAGKGVVYEVKINRIVSDKKEQLSSLLKMFGEKEAEVVIEGEKAIIKLKKELPELFREKLKEMSKELVGLSIEFVTQSLEKVNGSTAPQEKEKIVTEKKESQAS